MVLRCLVYLACKWLLIQRHTRALLFTLRSMNIYPCRCHVAERPASQIKCVDGFRRNAEGSIRYVRRRRWTRLARLCCVCRHCEEAPVVGLIRVGDADMVGPLGHLYRAWVHYCLIETWPGGGVSGGARALPRTGYPLSRTTRR